MATNFLQKLKSENINFFKEKVNKALRDALNNVKAPPPQKKSVSVKFFEIEING